MLHLSTTEVVATIFGSIVTFGSALGSFWNNHKANELEAQRERERQNVRDQHSSADLQKAEIAGWQTLIETTRHQYQTIVEQAASLQEKLDAALEKITVMTNEAEEMRDHIQELTKQIEKLGKT